MKKLLSLLITVIMLVSIPCAGASANESGSSPVYPDVTSAVIAQKLAECIEDGHPYLFGRKADFEALKEKIVNNTNPQLTERYNAVRLSAAHALDDLPAGMPEGFPDNGGYLSRGFDAWKIVMQCALVWLVEGNVNYAERAYNEAAFFANLDSWGTYQSISNNQAAFCVALCYDWLYDYLNDTQRSTLKNALLEKHLNNISDLFKDPNNNALLKFLRNAYDDYGSNHCAISNSATALQAIAVADTDNIDFYADIIATAIDKLKHENSVFDNFWPDGGWYEGLSYWGFTAPHIARMFAGFQSAFGTAFGYEDMDHILSTCYFPSYAQTELGYFRYGDVSVGKNNSPEKYYFAKLLGDTAYQKFLLGDGIVGKDSALMCLWYDTNIDYSTITEQMSKDKLFSNINMAVMRSSWNTSQGIFAGLKVSKANNGHNNMDSGTFVLDALGERWITNPGEDNYSLPGYWEADQNGDRWNYYSKRAEGNSCLVINPSSDGGQKVDADDKIDEFVSSDGFAYAITDLADTYADHVTSYRRGAALTHDRTRFVIRDEAMMKAASDVYSFINVYQSDITLVDDGKAAILSKGGKHVYVKIVTDSSYELSVTSAASLESSPSRHPLENDYTKDYQRIAIHFDDVEALNVSMVFVPFLDECELDGIDDYDAIPLSQWGSALSEVTMPKLSSLKVNGKELAGFTPHTRIYEYPSPVSYLDITATSDDSDADIEVVRDEYSYKIIVSNNDLVNVYSIDVPLEGTIVADSYIRGGSTYSTQNYGYDTKVWLIDSGKYATGAYYKISLPELSEDYEYKKVVLSLNQYRILGGASAIADTIGFFAIDNAAWAENTITYNNAPVHHIYSNNSYSFRRKGYDNNYSEPAYPTFSVSRSVSSALREGSEPSDSQYALEEYDITALATDSEFSFMMAITAYKSLSDHYIASKDHTVESLRPRVRVVVGKKGDARAIRSTNVEFTNENHNKLTTVDANGGCKASVFAGNDTSAPQQITLYLASYLGNELINIISTTRTVPQGGAELVTPILQLNSKASKIRAFVCKADMTPLAMSHQSEMEVSQ